MNVFLYTIALFAVAFVIHFVIWKIHLPKHHTIALLAIFLVTLAAGLILFFVFSRPVCLNCGELIPAACEGLQIIFLFISLTLSYIVSYSALKADSPSLIMTLAIAKSGSKGLDKDIFMKTMTDEVLVIPRINDLLRSNSVYEESQKLKLNNKGLFFTKLFLAYRKIIRAGKGG